MKGGKTKMDNKMMLGLLVIAIVIVAGFIYFPTSQAVVSAQGISSLEVKPDKVSIYINVESRADTAQKAKDGLDKILDDTITALLKTGLERKDIQLINLNVYPEYDWSDGEQKQKGFLATEQIIVETTNFDLVSGIADAAIDSGALLSYINFELSDDKQSEYKAMALEAASKDAKKKAEATARGLGKEIGTLVSIRSEDFNYGPYRYFDSAVVGTSAASVKEAVANPVPQELTVSATVNVEYKLKSF